MKQAAAMALCVGALGATGCSEIRVDIESDPTASYAKFKTYDWMRQPAIETDDPRADDPRLGEWIRSAVESELQRKGYAAAGDGRPDFLLAHHVAIEQRLRESDLARRGPYTQSEVWDVRFGRERSVPERRSRPRSYEVGTLIVDVADAESNRLVWRGCARARVNERRKPEETQARIVRAVEKMFARFPSRSE